MKKDKIQKEKNAHWSKWKNYQKIVRNKLIRNSQERNEIIEIKQNFLIKIITKGRGIPRTW